VREITMVRAAFGIELFQYLDAEAVVEEVRLVERLGYASVWLGDAQLLWREMYVLLGAAALATDRITLGAGVTNFATRHDSVTAGAIMTAQELSHGRTALGVGVGGTSTGMVGLPHTTRAEMTRAIQTVRALCGGQAVPAKGGDWRLVYAGNYPCPPIVIGASGPKVLRLAGQIGDGAMIGGGACAPDLLRAKLRSVRDGQETAERGGDQFRVYLATPAAVYPDERQALTAVKSQVAVAVGLVNNDWQLSDAARQAGALAREAYQHNEHMSPDASAKFDAIIPDEVAREFAIAGTADQCVARAQQVFELGVDEILLTPFALPGDSRSEMIEALERDVVRPALRGA
jgi:5,10-methylenetetrahydromethanopterin reductase